MNEISDQWMSIVEYARTFGISDMTIRRRIRTGRLKAILKDGKYFIPITKERMTELLHKDHPVNDFSPPEHASEENYRIPPAAPVSHPRIVRKDERSPTGDTKAENRRVLYPQNYPSIPSHIVHGFEGKEFTSIESVKLLEFSEKAFQTQHELIQQMQSKYQTQESLFHEQLKAKDVEIARLRQQIEDLQVLVQILESKQ